MYDVRRSMEELRGGNERVVHQQNRGDSDHSLCRGGRGCPPRHLRPDTGGGLGVRRVRVGHGLLRGLPRRVLLVDRVRTRPEDVAASTAEVRLGFVCHDGAWKIIPWLQSGYGYFYWRAKRPASAGTPQPFAERLRKTSVA